MMVKVSSRELHHQTAVLLCPHHDLYLHCPRLQLLTAVTTLQRRFYDHDLGEDDLRPQPHCDLKAIINAVHPTTAVSQITQFCHLVLSCDIFVRITLTTSAMRVVQKGVTWDTDRQINCHHFYTFFFLNPYICSTSPCE